MKKIIIQSMVVALVAATALTTINVVRFPELYITTYRQQLKSDIANGNEKAIEYYQKRYVANGKTLFEEFDYINLFEIKSYTVTSCGLYLETWGGNQFFIKK